jgi:hypothetical protein
MRKPEVTNLRGGAYEVHNDYWGRTLQGFMVSYIGLPPCVRALRNKCKELGHKVAYHKTSRSGGENHLQTAAVDISVLTNEIGQVTVTCIKQRYDEHK